MLIRALAVTAIYGGIMIAFNLLESGKLEPFRQAIAKFEFEDGINTASGDAKNIKQNLQVTGTNPAARTVIQKIKNIVTESQIIQGYAFINQVVGVRIALYRDGGHYDWHVDSPFMNGVRTDLSFTIFLSEPNTYDGGELLLDSDGRMQKFKGEAGQIIVYPTGRLHKVNPVTRGERLVVVGWINSHVRSEEDRSTLYKLGAEVNRLKKLVEDPSELDQLNYISMNLRRRLAD